MCLWRKNKMDNKLRTVTPCGILYTTMESYYLLSPVPVEKDSWQDNGTYRFVAVPINPVAIEDRGGKVLEIHGYARHIVTNAFSIEYKYNLPDIHIPVLDEIDLTLQEEKKENDEKDDFPF